jgi:hypothetical protein
MTVGNSCYSYRYFCSYSCCDVTPIILTPVIHIYIVIFIPNISPLLVTVGIFI